MSGKKIYLARHGERLDFVNPNWKTSAKLPEDAPLTSRGEQQATDLGNRLRSANIGNIYVSPFQRCVRTGVIAASRIGGDVRVRVEPGVCEWLSATWYEDAPEWQSLEQLQSGAAMVDNVSRIDTDYSPQRSHSYYKDGYPEPRRDLFTRCADVAKAIIRNDEGRGNILVVGHGSSVEGLFVSLCPGLLMRPVTYCCLTECIPREDETGYYKSELICDNSFITDSDDPNQTRYF